MIGNCAGSTWSWATSHTKSSGKFAAFFARRYVAEPRLDITHGLFGPCISTLRTHCLRLLQMTGRFRYFTPGCTMISWRTLWLCPSRFWGGMMWRKVWEFSRCNGLAGNLGYLALVQMEKWMYGVASAVRFWLWIKAASVCRESHWKPMSAELSHFQIGTEARTWVQGSLKLNMNIAQSRLFLPSPTQAYSYHGGLA